MSLVVAFVLCQPLTYVSSATPVRSTANNTASTADEDNNLKQQQCDLLASPDYELVLCPADPRLLYTPLKKEWPFRFRYPRMPSLPRVRTPRPPVLTLDGPAFLSVPQPLTSPVSSGCSGLPTQTNIPNEELLLALLGALFVLLMSFGLGVIVCWVVLKWKGDANAETKKGQIKRPPPPRGPCTTSAIPGRTLNDPQSRLTEVDEQNQSLWFQEIVDVLYGPTI